MMRILSGLAGLVGLVALVVALGWFAVPQNQQPPPTPVAGEPDTTIGGPVAGSESAGTDDGSAAVWGVVVDSDGRPVAEARVNAYVDGCSCSAEAESGADGTFHLQGLVPSPRLYISARKEGLVNWSEGPLTLPVGGLSGVRILLDKPGGRAGLAEDQPG